jgi:hypothetical protein
MKEEREKRDRARASEIRGGDRGLVGHARVVGRHAARRAEWEKKMDDNQIQVSGRRKSPGRVSKKIRSLGWKRWSDLNNENKF